MSNLGDFGWFGWEIIILSMFYVIVEKEDPTIDPERSFHSELQTLNEDLLSQAIRVKQHIQNHSASHVPTQKLSVDTHPTDSHRLITAYTVFSPHQPSFVHPWTLTPKSRNMRTKTQAERKHSFRMSRKDRQEGEKMFGRITMHCLRTERQSFEQGAAHLESHLSYTSRKLEHLKYQRNKEQEQTRLLKQIRQDGRQETEILTHISQHLSNEDRMSREKLRQRVLSQRAAKQHVLQGVHREKARVAYQQRLSSYQLNCEKKEQESYSQYEKRLMCQKEQQSRKQSQRNRRQCLEDKKLEAKAKFRNKWINEFKKASESKRNLTQKQQAFALKIQKAIQTSSQLSPFIPPFCPCASP